MSLPCHVALEDVGPIGKDDGKTALDLIKLLLAVAGGHLLADITVDRYSGGATVKIGRDDFGLPTRLAHPLLEAVYWLSNTSMRQCDVADSEAYFDIQGLISNRFYGGDARTLIKTLQNPH